MNAGEHRVVIVVGGFAGLNAARALRNAHVEITLIDRRNFHLFQPLLYQVATGGLSPANIAAPLRSILRRQRNARVLLAEVVDVDVARREVIFPEGVIGYDTLIVATGASHHYFGHDEWVALAPGLKTIEDATSIRARLLLAFEMAERDAGRAMCAQWLTFVVVGGGPTGVELAGALSEVARDTLMHDFRAIDLAEARILLVEAGERILPSYDARLATKAGAALRRLGVEVLTDAAVSGIQDGAVAVRRDGPSDEIVSRTVPWAAGCPGVASQPPPRQPHGRRGGQGRADRGAARPDSARTSRSHGAGVHGAARGRGRSVHARSCLGGDPAKKVRWATPGTAPRRRELRAVPLSRQGQHGDDRPRGSRCGPWPGEALRLPGVARLALRPSTELDRLRESAAGGPGITPRGTAPRG